MRRIRELWKPGDWAGSDVYVVGGGPSLKGFDHRKLTHKRLSGSKVLCINKSLPDFIPDARVTIDDRWADWMTLDVNYDWEDKFPLCYIGHPWLTGRRWERIYQEDSLEHAGKIKEHPWPSGFEHGGRAGSNSGVATIWLADVLGAARILLLGFDCQPNESGRTQHHHDGYSKEGFGDQPGCVYDRFIRDFENIVRPNVRAKVINLNPDSAIGCFEKEPIEKWL